MNPESQTPRGDAEEAMPLLAPVAAGLAPRRVRAAAVTVPAR
ncbi:hypothetical protein [[Mycobacterium] manitobense]|nr:hypothetical protein [[Mycobacterium] manitobense]